MKPFLILLAVAAFWLGAKVQEATASRQFAAITSTQVNRGALADVRH